MICVMSVISLVLSEGWRKSQAANFYLAPTRAWELLAGQFLLLSNKKYINTFNGNSIFNCLCI